MNSSGFLPFVAMLLVLWIEVSPTYSFRISTISSMTSSSSMLRNNWMSTNLSSSPISSSSIVLKSSQRANEEEDDEAATVGGNDGSLDIGGVLGTIASIVVLRSEFVLKTTGCGLPAGPFGIVGAIEGVSYLGVVATCAAAAVDYFSEDGVEGSDNLTRRLATILAGSAAVAGIAVLVFQVTDYGYIPNAVPMEGGMCK